MRGVFLRGKNHTRSDGKEDPAGDQAIGTYQADQLQNHMHNWLPLTIPGAFEAMDIPEASSYAPRGGSLYGVFNGAWTGESQVTNYRPHVGSVTTSGSWDTGMGPLVLARAGAE